MAAISAKLVGGGTELGEIVPILNSNGNCAVLASSIPVSSNSDYHSMVRTVYKVCSCGVSYRHICSTVGRFGFAATSVFLMELMVGRVHIACSVSGVDLCSVCRGLTLSRLCNSRRQLFNITHRLFRCIFSRSCGIGATKCGNTV